MAAKRSLWIVKWVKVGVRFKLPQPLPGSNGSARYAGLADDISGVGRNPRRCCWSEKCVCYALSRFGISLPNHKFTLDCVRTTTTPPPTPTPTPHPFDFWILLYVNTRIILTWWAHEELSIQSISFKHPCSSYIITLDHKAKETSAFDLHSWSKHSSRLPVARCVRVCVCVWLFSMPSPDESPHLRTHKDRM